MVVLACCTTVAGTFYSVMSGQVQGQGAVHSAGTKDGTEGGMHLEDAVRDVTRHFPSQSTQRGGDTYATAAVVNAFRAIHQSCRERRLPVQLISTGLPS